MYIRVQLIYRINTWRFLCLGMTTCFCVVLTSLLTNFNKRKLTYRAWLPFNYSSTTLFCLVYVHQQISVVANLLMNVAGALLNIACDSLICGLLVHACCQMEILTYRLGKIMSYSGALHDCVRQHSRIFRLVFIIADFRIFLQLNPGIISDIIIVTSILLKIDTS